MHSIKPTHTLRAMLLALLTAVTLATAVSAAQAHVALVSTGPARGATITTSPASAWILFGGTIRSGTLKVTGPGGVVSVGRGGRDPRNVRRLLVALKPHLKPGRYTAHGATIAADTHHQTWTFTFTIKAKKKH